MLVLIYIIIYCVLCRTIRSIFGAIIASLKNGDFSRMFMADSRAAQGNSEAETLQKVARHTLDRRKLGQSPNELRSFGQISYNAEKSCWRPGWSFFELAANAPELLSKLSVGIHIKAFRVTLKLNSYS